MMTRTSRSYAPCAAASITTSSLSADKEKHPAGWPKYEDGLTGTPDDDDDE